METFQTFMLTAVTGGPTNWYGRVAFALDRGASYYQNREERGKIDRLDFGFGNLRISQSFQLASLGVSSYNFFKVPQENGLTGYQNTAINIWNFGLLGSGIGRHYLLPYAF